VKVLLEIHVRGTQKKKPSEFLHGLKYIDVRSVVGEDGKQISSWSRD